MKGRFIERVSCNGSLAGLLDRHDQYHHRAGNMVRLWLLGSSGSV